MSELNFNTFFNSDIMFDLIDDLSTEIWEDKGTPPDDLAQIGKKYCVRYAIIPLRKICKSARFH